ncbi:hypothetical protein GIB67_010944 [Kingdonia uniflora]|uniref:GDT1 family protein n=1 Tax=Kingdonia uniflora TaxID=39325 RepID=A0A7J7NV74_9MAGN|nr:hypothetical protein GIB67_010944 [Kingdonia uniflora]
MESDGEIVLGLVIGGSDGEGVLVDALVFGGMVGAVEIGEGSTGKLMVGDEGILVGSGLGKVRCNESLRFFSSCGRISAQASNVSIGSGGYEQGEENDKREVFIENLPGETPSKPEAPLSQVPYLVSIAVVLLVCALAFSLIAFANGGPSSILAAIAKSGFTAAFMLIFVSEIGDKVVVEISKCNSTRSIVFNVIKIHEQYKGVIALAYLYHNLNRASKANVKQVGEFLTLLETFFIAALLAMQYEKALVLLGSVAALSLMTALSVVIGRIFHSVPAQFQTTLPIGEYAAVTLLMFFGLKSLKEAWDLPSNVAKTGKNNSELGEFVEAEELVNEKVAKRLTNPLEIIWKSFSLVFFAEWGDRSMLATIALGAAQSPWGVASGAIAGHLLATTVAVIGGAFLANYISEKLVGYIGGTLFLVFAGATLLGVF